MKQGTSSVTEQHDKMMTNALLIVRGTLRPSHSQFLFTQQTNEQSTLLHPEELEVLLIQLKNKLSAAFTNLRSDFNS